MVRNLSTLLRQLPLHPHPLRADPRFRNPAGVARKVQNLMWEATGHTAGSPHTSAMDRHVIDELAYKAEVQRIAPAIGDASERALDRSVGSPSAVVTGASPRRRLEYSHRRRERDRKMVQRKKDARWCEPARPLVCEVCGDVAGR